MSMNLQARADGQLIEVWQTPTSVTYMICVNHEGLISPTGITGKEARRALYAYVEWVRGQMNGVYDTTEQFKAQADLINGHVAYILEIIKRAKTLKVYFT